MEKEPTGEMLPIAVQRVLKDLRLALEERWPDTEGDVEQEGTTCYFNITGGSITTGELEELLKQLRNDHPDVICQMGDDGEVMIRAKSPSQESKSNFEEGIIPDNVNDAALFLDWTIHNEFGLYSALDEEGFNIRLTILGNFAADNFNILEQKLKANGFDTVTIVLEAKDELQTIVISSARLN